MLFFGVFLVLVFLFGLVSERIEQTVLTAPLVFTAGGFLLALFLPGLSQVEVHSAGVLWFCEGTLALLIFADAGHLSLGALRLSSSLAARLLDFGLPLTILAGLLVGVLLFPQLSLWEAGILASILAPTDLGLGALVVKSPRVPERIREALVVEGGLNDGIAVPVLVLFLALARAGQSGQPLSWISFALQQIGVGLVVGMVLAGGGGWLMNQARKQGWMTLPFQSFGLLALAGLTFLTADVLGGSGFIAVFAAGVAIRLVFQEAAAHLLTFGEEWGSLLSYAVFFIFGTEVVAFMPHFGFLVWLYGLLSLTLVRLLPVAISLIGTRLHLSTVFFMGWFGPRGLASIVLGLLYLEQTISLPGEPQIVWAVAATVLLSIVAHGMTAMPGISLYARKIAQFPSDAPELLPVPSRGHRFRQSTSQEAS
jgi:sodium/hydrogen antiporter